MATILASSKVRSGARTALIIITALNIFRLPSVLSGFTLPNLPAYEWIPGWGDTLAGFLAILIVYALLRGRGLSVWTVAVIWNIYGMLDVLNAAFLRLLMPQVNTPFAIPGGLLGPIMLTTLHLINLFLLSRPKVLDHYLSLKR